MSDEPAYSGKSSSAVRKATGKSWDEWIALLDKANATSMTHKEIAQWLQDEGHIESGWWAQSVTVGYEQARGMRKVNQKVDGFSFSVSKTMPLPVAPLFEAWVSPEKRAVWLPGSEKLQITTANTDKNIRGKRTDDASYVMAAFYPKGEARTQVVVQIERLKSESDVEQRRAEWRDAVNALQAFVSVG